MYEVRTTTIKMFDQCTDLDKLSAERKWDDVFHCLKIDVNSTIELGILKVPRITDKDDQWLDDHKATMNSLEVILAIILLFDQLFYLLLLWYLLCFVIKFVRYRGFALLKQTAKKLNVKETPIVTKQSKLRTPAKRKSLTFAKGTFDFSK